MSVTANLVTPNGIKYTQPTGLFINGEFVTGSSGKTFDTYSPTTEELITCVHEAENEDVEVAIKAAESAFKHWSTIPSDERGHYLYKLADLLEKNRELFSALDSWDNGKTLEMARGDVNTSISAFRTFAGWADKIYGDVIETDSDHFTYTRREPIGVCGMIIPWNFPILMFAWKAAPSLAAGCTFVLKSAENTPLSALLISQLFHEAGFPAGVVNVVSGFGSVGAYIAQHPRIAMVSFTGSTATGRRIMEASAKTNLKKFSLELGGKSANIVFDDANLDNAIDSVMYGIFYNSGQVCTAGSRLYLQNNIYDKFLETLVEKVKKMKVGDPFEKDSYYGPQISKTQLDLILKYIDQGHKEGARLITGGKRMERKGYFVEPTIFADVQNHHTIAKEEIFGPVLSVLRFDKVEDAIELANDSDYGLAAGIHTSNINRAVYISSQLKAGTVWVNTYNEILPQIPFGGYRASGIGREQGKEALDIYTEIKSVRIAGIRKGAH